jgi:hypothetical protein
VGLELRFPARAGTRLVGVSFLAETVESETELQQPHLYEEDVVSGYKVGSPAVDSVTISGPYDATGIGDTASRRKIFVCYPSTSEVSGNQSKVGPLKIRNANEEESCATKILSTLARRAYRRPITDGDIEVLLGYYTSGHREGGFERGIRMALERMLVSPEFLFRIERDPANVMPRTAYRITDLELASRLSFFLWSNIPDDELLELAERGKLHDPEVLEQQIRRMLGDLRSRALVNNFIGQWLSLRNLQTMSPDPQVFPEFDENLRDALRQETELLFESMVREDRSLLDVLNANYTFLNERLARHYDIPNVFGSHFRRVALGNDHAERRGLFGLGSVLTVTSYANRTAPTIRGKWILDNLMGTPPPPPPPNVPSLKEENGENDVVLTMRQRMEQHRVNPACAVCHQLMDPLGFALENFDALGKWRVDEGGTPIDPSGALPGGTKIQGPVEMREIFLQRGDQFVTTVTEKLLMYALGRRIEYYDQPILRRIIREAASTNYRWSSLIMSIVKSEPFQMRRSREP